MAAVHRLKNLQKVLKELQKQAHRQTLHSVVVGFSAAYALYVHENLEMKLAGEPRPSGIGVYWGPSGQAKYLEGPAREMQPELGRIVGQVAKRTGSIEQGLLAAGLRLQREAQKRVPVEYGNLKNSAFTRVE